MICLQLAPKLTNQHIDLPPFSKMKVKLLHKFSVEESLTHCLITFFSGDLPVEANQTAEFVGHTYKLFDCFNSNQMTNSKFLKHPLRKDSAHFEFLQKMKLLFSKLRVIAA